VFRSLNGGIRLHGAAGSLVLGSTPAATVRNWHIRRSKSHPGKWVLTATIETVHPFYVRQRPLMFVPPRLNGFWCWGIESIDVGATQLVARLGPPEQ
jgi:hypothetical protein